MKAKGFRNIRHTNNKHKIAEVAALTKKNKNTSRQGVVTSTRKTISKTSKDRFNKKI